MEVTLTETRNGKKVAARVGDTIIVRLSDNPSGGYRWTLTSSDSARLEMVEHRYEPARAGVGSAGAAVWTFSPKKSGRTRLELKRLRPWNQADPAAERFAVDLEIRAE